MIIFPQEQIDGVEELVRSSASISYEMPLLSEPNISKASLESLDKLVIAKFMRAEDRFDLHPIYSILVSMAWNKNDDVFTKEQAWPARNSPQDKPFNFMHNQTDIIGHITNSFVVDHSFSQIDDTTHPDVVPDKFHIITAGVIYRVWENPQLQSRMDKIIAEIKEGNKWYVSMECLFKGFDYGVIKANGESMVIERNEHTSALTKHLRAYGGPGVYNGHKIGRVLRDITFSGKGLVNNPANPDSVILNNFNPSCAKMVYLNNMNPIGGESMSEVETLKAQVAELTAKLESQKSSSLLEQIAALKTGHAEEVGLINKSLSDLKSQAEKDKKEKDDFFKDKDKDKAEIEQLKADNEFMKKSLEEYKKAGKKKDRETALLRKEYAAEYVTKLVETTFALSDEEFDGLVAALDEAVAKKKKDKEDGATAPPIGPGGVQPNIAGVNDHKPIDGGVPADKVPDIKDGDTNKENKKGQKSAQKFAGAEEKDDKDVDKKDMKEDCDAKTKEVTVDPVDVITTATAETSYNLGVSSNEQTETAKAIDAWYKSFKKAETK